MGNSYQILIQRLEEFIRKYYKNQLIRGTLYSLTLGLSFYISLVITAYYGEFSIPIRTILFYLFLAGNAFILVRYIAIPLLKLYHIGEVLSYKEAATIIGKHFTEVQDKLLNVLQLREQHADMASTALLEAGIDQKIKDIRPVPFNVAIDISENRKYLRYLFIPLALITFIWLIRPALLRQGSKQIFNYNTVYAKLAPFQFNVENKNLNAIEQKDFTLNLKLTGSEVPEEVFITYNGNRFKMERNSAVAFQYAFRNVQHDMNFSFQAAGFESDGYKLTVIPDPVLVNFDIKLHYPAYTGRKDEVVHNTGDISIPQGTVANWEFNTRNTDNILLRFSDSTRKLEQSGTDIYTYRRRFMQSQNYSISTSNKFMVNQDSVKYAIQVIPDLYPGIEVEKKEDSMSAKHLYFNGAVKDDYGFSKLNFVYRIYNADDSSPKSGTIHKLDLGIAKNVINQPFYFYWNLDTLNLWPGQQIEYYFEVWDNDEVNGSKCTKSNVMYFKIPSLDEIQKTTNENTDKTQNDISKTIQEAYSLQNQMEQKRADMYNKQELNWADKKQIKDMLQKQQELQKKVDELSKQNEKNNNKQWDFQKKDSSLMQKQEELQKLFNALANDSLKKKLEELQKKLDQMNKDQVQQELEKLSMNNQDMKKELERTLELFKQLDFQQNLTQQIQKLDSLAKKQQQLSEQSKNSKGNNEDLQKKQDELNKEFQQTSKDLQDLEKKNSQLENPTGFKNPEQQEQSIQQQQQQSSQQLAKNQNSKASQTQKSASQGMQKMADEMEAQQQQSSEEAEGANENSLRNILNNLVQLSFAQEDLMKLTNAAANSNMQYAEAAKKQKDMQENARSIEDSLYALSKKAPEVQGAMNQEMSSINYNMKEAIGEMESRRGSEAAGRQQYSMTAINNLALMLSDVLGAMQAQSKNHSPGSGSCNKPGGKGNHPSMSQLRQMQQQLSDQLSQMQKSMQSGEKGNKPGGKTSQNDEKMSEQLAKMAAQQEYIREQMQQAEDELDQNKKGGGALGNISQEMNKNQEDILNRQITESTLERQQEILKHLLEYEKAEKTQGQDPNFESHVAKKQFFGNPNPFFQYNIQKTQQNELLKTVPPDFNTFYKDKVNDYFNSFQQ
jgi:hypothetical protein